MKKIVYPVVLVGTILIGGILAYSIWKASPQTSQEFFSNGKKYYDAKKYSEATIQFLNAVRKDPRDRDARFFLALSFVKQKELTQAAKELTALLEYYPDDEAANLQLGSIYLLGGRSDSKFFRQSQEIAEKILAKKPQNVAALILKGNAMAGLQDYRSSVELFEEALKLDPQNAAIFVDLGTTQTLQKNYAEAEAAFLKARQMDPQNRNAVLSLANYYRAVGKTDKADAVFREAFALDPTDREIYLQMAAFFYRTGRFEQ